MAKRKRHTGKSSKTEEDVSAFDPKESRKRIRTYEDVADSDDEFHMNQDKILLEEDPASQRRRKQHEQEEFLDQSDEEILAGPSDDEPAYDSEGQEQDDGLDLESQDEDAETEDEEAEDGWGTANMYGADAIETEEQALEEEAEARRLQRKHLQSMSAADYGFDEDEWQTTPTENDGVKNNSTTEVLPELEITQDLTPTERLKMLKSRYPEFELLRKEFLTMQEICRDMEPQALNDQHLRPNAFAKAQAATAYLGSLAMYFALLTSGDDLADNRKPMAATRLREHAIMTMLVDCRSSWKATQALPKDRVRTKESGIETQAAINRKQDSETLDHIPATQMRKTRKERHTEAVDAAKAARIAERLRQTEADFKDLDALLVSSKSKTKSNGAMTLVDDAEQIPLTAAQAEEKAKRKKSLRFYTSQIAQTANKRGNAGRNAGGDDDVPHRERLRDRQARLNAEAEKRGKPRADIGDDLGTASDDEDVMQARQVRDQVDDEDYYDMVAAKTAKKRQDKSDRADAQRKADAEGGRVVEQEAIGADGKRRITYAIEKNKGLTPHRNKSVRNSRVKKRIKYEQKNKKLASMKPVYKGGEGRGGYGGELTGIKANLVKSVKL